MHGLRNGHEQILDAEDGHRTKSTVRVSRVLQESRQRDRLLAEPHEEERVMNICEQLKLILWYEGKSQTWLANKAGVSVSTVNSYVNGRYKPNIGTVELLLDALDYELKIEKKGKRK